MAAVAHPQIAPEEYLALQARAGWRLDVELIDGEAVVIPPTGGQAASLQGCLFLALSRWQELTDDRGLLLQDVFVAFPGGRYLAPDIAWWSGTRRPVVPDGALDSLPDLIIEVLSPATRSNDRGVKRDLYMSSGVRELWLADPRARSLIRVQPDPGDEEVLDTRDVLQSALLDGFALDLAQVFCTP
jgi:Uma2 family endonuclease